MNKIFYNTLNFNVNCAIIFAAKDDISLQSHTLLFGFQIAQAILL